jgi:hypothetical protein
MCPVISASDINNVTSTMAGERLQFLICLQLVLTVDHPNADQIQVATRSGVLCSSPAHFMRLCSAGYCARLLDVMKMVTYSYAGSLTRDLTKICLKFTIGLPTYKEVGLWFNVN